MLPVTTVCNIISVAVDTAVRCPIVASAWAAGDRPSETSGTMSNPMLTAKYDMKALRDAASPHRSRRRRDRGPRGEERAAVARAAGVSSPHRRRRKELEAIDNDLKQVLMKLKGAAPAPKRGPAAAACSYSDEGGRNTVDAATGTNKWVDGPPTNQTFLLLHNASAAGAAINELLCQL